MTNKYGFYWRDSLNSPEGPDFRSVCGASNVTGSCWGGVEETLPDGSITRNEVAYADADEICASAGARICTASEMENGFTRGTGCSLDTRLVWTSTPCAAGEEFCAAGRAVRTGRGTMPAGRTMPSKSSFAVRCCADSIAAAVEDSSGPPTSRLSELPCVVLQRNHRDWPRPFAYRQANGVAQSSVCAASQISAECHRSDSTSSHTVHTARVVCAAVGSRLCTSSELESGIAKGTGCNLDNVPVWSSSACNIASGRAGFYTVSGGGLGGGVASTSCEPALLGDASVRCCADALIRAAAANSDAVIEGDGTSTGNAGRAAAAAGGSMPAVISGLAVTALLGAVVGAIIRKRWRTSRYVSTVPPVAVQALNSRRGHKCLFLQHFMMDGSVARHVTMVSPTRTQCLYN